MQIRSQACSETSAVDDRSREPLPRAAAATDISTPSTRRATRSSRAVAAVDDRRPEIGEKYVFPLFYGDDGNSYIIVASKGGAPDHPGWYKNLLANPEVEVQVGTKKVKAKARTVTGAERRAVEKAVKFWPPYADYAKKTPRQIPVVVLDPV